MEELNEQTVSSAAYTEENIRHLSDMEHVRTRPGMYIGRLGDGSQVEDGIYVLLKEVVDNSIDEFKMGAGKRIDIQMEDNLRVSVRDYGRGIPLGSLVDAVSMLNTGGKYDTKAFKKSVGLNGVGAKAVNALSRRFIAWSAATDRCARPCSNAVNWSATKPVLRTKKTEPISSLNLTIPCS